MIAERRGLSDVRMTHHGHVVPMFTVVVVVLGLQRLGGLWQAGESFIRFH